MHTTGHPHAAILLMTNRSWCTLMLHRVRLAFLPTAQHATCGSGGAVSQFLLTHFNRPPSISVARSAKFHSQQFRNLPTMAKQNGAADLAIKELEQSLKTIGLSEIPKMPDTHPELNPLDVYRSHIAQLLASVSDIDPKIIFPAVHRTQTLDKGDVVVAVPALRVKGKKPDALAAELAGKVTKATPGDREAEADIYTSSQSRPSSSRPQQQGHSCSSSSSPKPLPRSSSRPSSAHRSRTASTPT